MVGPLNVYALDHLGPVPLGIGLFLTATALVALCAKHSSRVKRSPASQPPKTTSVESASGPKLPATPKSPRAYPKQLLALVSNKGSIPTPKKKETNGDYESRGPEEGKVEAMGGFGEGGVWQRSILMGDKCRAPEFSGAIYYDSQGNQLPEPPPRSPRASPMPSFFSVAIEKEPE